MKLQILGCSGGLARDRRLSSYLIDDQQLVQIDGRRLAERRHIDGDVAVGDHALELVVLAHRQGAEIV